MRGTTEQPGQDNGVRSYVKAVWHWVAYWGVRGGFVVVVSLVILAYLHIIEEPKYLLPLISGLILFLSEQLLESDRQIKEQGTAIQSVIDIAGLRLYALHDCVRDFDETLDSIRPREKVIIEHLGLKIKFEVRKYRAIPVVLGFRIVSPMKRCYMAICRWGGSDYQKYGWGNRSIT